ncbi:hypothetical protein QQF64_021820 [Cirrhinus molitorella]|uniref:Chemokine interleukin-8-like domain-containing protein n=1 Tax=Cirrhinus molitorella TaxID=172907 RepID=A0ABR3LA23_9TELE
MRFLFCLPFCLVLFLFCLIAETSQHRSTCCLQARKNRTPLNRVLCYTVQKAGVCPISAIVLLTKGGKAKCVDPDSDWIKDVMDQKKILQCQNGKTKNKIRGKGHRQKNQKKKS